MFNIVLVTNLFCLGLAAYIVSYRNIFKSKGYSDIKDVKLKQVLRVSMYNEYLSVLNTKMKKQLTFCLAYFIPTTLFIIYVTFISNPFTNNMSLGRGIIAVTIYFLLCVMLVVTVYSISGDIIVKSIYNEEKVINEIFTLHYKKLSPESYTVIRSIYISLSDSEYKEYIKASSKTSRLYKVLSSFRKVYDYSQFNEQTLYLMNKEMLDKDTVNMFSKLTIILNSYELLTETLDETDKPDVQEFFDLLLARIDKIELILNAEVELQYILINRRFEKESKVRQEKVKLIDNKNKDALSSLLKQDF